MKPITDKPLSIIWRFLSVLARCHVWYFLIIATFIPSRSKALSFEVRHDRESVFDKIVNVGVLDVSSRMFGGFGFELGDNILKLVCENSSQSIIFGAVKKQDSPPIRENAGKDREDNVMVDLHWVILSILMGCIVSDFFGRLYGLVIDLTIWITCARNHRYQNLTRLI